MPAFLNRRDRVAVTTGAVALVLFLLLQFGLLPWLERLPAQRTELEDKELTLQRYQRLVGRTGTEQARLATAQERLKTLEASLLDSRSASLANAEWRQLVRELAESRGIELGRSEFLRLQNLSPDYALVAGRVQFRCRVDQLVDFLVALATSPKLLSVRGLRIAAVQRDPEKRIIVEMTIAAAMAAQGPAPAAKP